MKQAVKTYRKFMNSHNRTLLLLDVAFKVFFCVFVLPPFGYGMDYVMHLWGQSYLTTANLPTFLSFPPTLVLLLMMVLLLAVFLFTEETTLIYYCGLSGSGRKPKLPGLFSIGWKKAVHCIRNGNILLPFYSILLFLFTSLTILTGITIYARIDLSGGASDAVFIKGLIILTLIFICFVTFRGMFAIYYCINEHQRMADGIAQSKQLLKGRGLKTAATLILYNAILTAGFFVFYYVLLALAALMVYLFTDKSMVITVFLSAYPKINFYAFLLFGSVAFTTNLNLISSLFSAYREEEFKEIHPEDCRFSEYPPGIRKKKHSPILTGIFIVLLAAGILNFYLSIRNDTFYLQEALSGIIITSHRGNSHVAPENTLPALENAIIARSDYAEVDIQQTKDGEIVLLHDPNLWRTTGVNRNIWDLTYTEVEELDAGYWFAAEFEHTKIPTLTEAFELCKGRIKLNIEVKANGHEQDIEEKLVKMIEDYDFEHQCVVSSWSYETLSKIKMLNSEIKTGFIISATYGDFYDRENIDFFSVRSGFLSKALINNAHKAGKEVHAWTVDTVSELERMKSLGVDCIITDNPTLAREVLYRSDKNKSLIELLNRMLYNRSFYKIVQDQY